MKELLISFARGNLWSNRMLFEYILANTTGEMHDREIVSSFPSIRKTIYHIWNAETIWQYRLRRQKIIVPTEGFTGTLDEAIQMLLNGGEDFVRMLEEKPEDQFNEVYRVKMMNGNEYEVTFANAVTHCMNHSSYHRGQLVTMLRQCGLTDIPQTDYIQYCRKN